jgi:proteasome lid subunit RPN8/RPN11
MKLKERKLKAILAEGWLRVTDRPVPTNEAVADQVAIHNKSYPEMLAKLGEGWRRKPETLAQSMLPIHYGGSARTVDIKPKTDFDWTCKVSDVEGCPLVEAPTVEVPIELYRAWTELAGEFNTEWMAFLVGELDTVKGRAKITEMYFPPQSASGAHVEVPDDVQFRPKPGTIGAVHSHVNMQAFFSTTDKDHANWPIEIVINSRGEYEMNMRIKLDCSRYSRVKGKILLVGAKAADVYRDQLKEALKPDVNLKGYGEDFEGYNYVGGRIV